MMNWLRRPQLLAFIFGVIGYAILIACMIGLSARTANWGQPQLARAEAIARAQAVAAQMMDGQFAPVDWRASVSAEAQNLSDYYITKYPAKAGQAPFLSPVKTTVLLSEPRAPYRRIAIELIVAGQCVGYNLYDPSAKPNNDAPPPLPIDAATRQTAEKALSQMLGDASQQFRLVSQTREGKGGTSRITWGRKLVDNDDLMVQATALVRGQGASEVKVTTVFAPRLTGQFDERSAYFWRDPVVVLMSLLTGLLVGIFYFVGLVRREISHRSAIVLLGAMLFLGLVYAFFAGLYDEAFVKMNAEESPLTRFIGQVAASFAPPFAAALSFAIVWAVGLWLARRGDVSKHLSLLGLLKAKFFARTVGKRLFGGIMLGGVIAALPLLLAASGIAPGWKMAPPHANLYVAASPLLAALLAIPPLDLFALYGFIVPLKIVYTKSRRRLQFLRVIVIASGALWLFESYGAHYNVAGAFLAAIVTIIVADQIFRRYDLLTLLAAFVCADISFSTMALLMQPAKTLRDAGWWSAATLVIAACASFAIGIKGRRTPLEEDADARPLQVDRALLRDERERLMAEFSVARRAQQRMLPKVFPVIPGYQITAHCTPAREVGGDLYDFIRLSDERLGIVVADVSGKGVPASLYMTLTKGLLASIAENESDPYRILCEVNRHLYEACRRKVFVTLVLGVLEPATKTFTYARAGHNPALWRRAREGKTEWLRAPGIGLGLSKNKLFNRSLKVETIHVDFGDALVFYSDGVTEAMNELGEEYGEERLLAVVEQTDGLSAAATQDAILSDVHFFLNGIHQQDDMTLAIMRINER